MFLTNKLNFSISVFLNIVSCLALLRTKLLVFGCLATIFALIHILISLQL